MNSVNLIGCLSKDVTTKRAKSGVLCGMFTLAVKRTYQNGSENDADFVPICTFGKVAENCEHYLSKGSRVAVSGSLKIDNVQDGTDWKTYVSVNATSVEFLSSGKNGAKNNGERRQTRPQQNSPTPEDDGYPELRNRNRQQDGSQLTADDYYRKRSYTEYDDDGELPF